ncbi:MAG: NUDIX hydrolase [Ilumatobacteraceae bacterium]
MSGFRRTAERQVHQGYVWRLVTADYESPDGAPFTRDIVRSPGAVGVVPVLEPEPGRFEIVLVRQWRAPYETELWEIPAGMRDVEGEDPAETARRELIEEAGYRAGSVEELGRIYPSPGLTDAITWIYLATELTPVAQDLQGPEEEHLVVEVVALEEAVAMVDRGEILDAKTVVGVLRAARRLAPGR